MSVLKKSGRGGEKISTPAVTFKVSRAPAFDELRGHFGDAAALEARGGERRLVGLERAVVAREGDAVRVAGLELDGVEVTGRDEDAAPVVEDRADGEDGRLLPAVVRGGARE